MFPVATMMSTDCSCDVESAAPTMAQVADVGFPLIEAAIEASTMGFPWDPHDLPDATLIHLMRIHACTACLAAVRVRLYDDLALPVVFTIIDGVLVGGTVPVDAAPASGQHDAVARDDSSDIFTSAELEGVRMMASSRLSGTKGYQPEVTVDEAVSCSNVAVTVDGEDMHPAGLFVRAVNSSKVHDGLHGCLEFRLDDVDDGDVLLHETVNSGGGVDYMVDAYNTFVTFGSSGGTAAEVGLPSVDSEASRDAGFTTPRMRRNRRFSCRDGYETPPPVDAKQAEAEATKEHPHKPRFTAGAIGPNCRAVPTSPRLGIPSLRNVSRDELAESYKVGSAFAWVGHLRSLHYSAEVPEV